MFFFYTFLDNVSHISCSGTTVASTLVRTVYNKLLMYWEFPAHRLNDNISSELFFKRSLVNKCLVSDVNWSKNKIMFLFKSATSNNRRLVFGDASHLNSGN